MKVKCLENKTDKKGKKDCPNITVGKIYHNVQYPTSGTFKYCVRITDDSGIIGWYSKDRFEVVDER